VVQVIYEKLVDLTGNPAVPLVLVGNKSDLHTERRITEATGRKLAADMKAVFLETSAKDNQCAMDLFTKSILQIEKVGLVRRAKRSPLSTAGGREHCGGEEKLCGILTSLGS
jgi:Ras family protein